MDTATTTKTKPQAITSRLDGVRRHKLLTAADAHKLPALYATEGQPVKTAVVKVFSPWLNVTHYVVEYDGTDIAFVFTTVPGQPSEYGYVSLQELADTQHPRFPGLPVFEQDKWFEPTTVGVIDFEQRVNGR